jgi:hypothetical protein
MSIADNYRLIRNRIEENQLNYWRCYQSYQYLAEIDDLRAFVAGYTNWRFETLTADEIGLLESIEAHINRLEELRADLLKADADELKRLYESK